MPLRRSEIVDRFWSKVNKDGPTMPNMDTPCWEWTRARDKDGYGLTRNRALSKSNIRAHRLSALWAGIISDLTDGHLICHNCDNPSCVNPDHLWRGTPAENIDDRSKKDRGARQLGSSNGWSRLTEDDVRCIKNLLLAGATQKMIANQFGVSVPTISHINNGRRWSHV